MKPDAETLLRQMLEEDDEIREEHQKYHQLRDDPRVTRTGHFLRKTILLTSCPSFGTCSREGCA